MDVLLGDGRRVECASGITKVSPGPMPLVLDAEICRADSKRATPHVNVMRRGFFDGDPRPRENRHSDELGMMLSMLDPMGGREEKEYDAT